MSEYGVLALIHRLLASPAGCGISILSIVSIVHTLLYVRKRKAHRHRAHAVHIAIATETTAAADDSLIVLPIVRRVEVWAHGG